VLFFTGTLSASIGLGLAADSYFQVIAFLFAATTIWFSASNISTNYLLIRSLTVIAGLLCFTGTAPFYLLNILISAILFRINLNNGMALALIVSLSSGSKIAESLFNLFFPFDYENSYVFIFTLILVLVAGTLKEFKQLIAAVIYLLAVPHLAMIYTELFSVLFLFLLLYSFKKTNVNNTKTAYALAGIFLLLTHLSLPITPINNLWVLLPNDQKSYEAKFFENYQAVLDFSGISTSVTTSLETIPNNSTVFVPWTTSNNLDFTQIRSALKDKNLNLIYAAEHTNMGNNRENLIAITGHGRINDDLLTPKKNSDFLGISRSPSIIELPLNTALNRGASLNNEGLVLPVIQVDGWWSEPNIHEWLWVGDYIWEPGDKKGRLTVATIEKYGKSKIMVVSDNSFLLAHHIVADPRPLKRLLSIFTMIPTFVLDIIIVALLYAITIKSVTRSTQLVLFLFLASYGVVQYVFTYDSPSRWDEYYIGEDGFSPHGFNQNIAKLLGSEPKLRVLRDKPISKNEKSQDGPVLVFWSRKFIAKNEYAQRLLSDCHDLGNVTSDEGARIYDGLACKIPPTFIPVIGTSTSAAAFEDNKGNLIILDEKFLSNQLGVENARWIEEVISTRHMPD